MFSDLEYTVNDYEYRTYLDVEEDCMKLFHYCYKNGQEIRMPIEFYNESPYSKVKPEKFKQYIRELEVFIQG